MEKTVKEHIEQFYAINQFDEDGGVSKSWVWIKFGFISFPLPNTTSRKDNVILHDINHLITDNNTTWKGESAVSSWEIASGGWKKFYVPWVLTLWAMGLGIVFYYKSTYLSFKKGLMMRNALTVGISKSDILNYKTSDLIKQVSNHPKSNRNFYLWMMLSLFVFILPFAIVFYLIQLLIN
jgi:hypothetical protein